MGKINDYPVSSPITDSVMLFGTDESGETASFNAEDIETYVHSAASRGDMYNTAPVAATLTDADTWYELSSASLIGANLSNFTFSNGEFTYTKATPTTFLFNGAANVAVDKACELTLGLYVNETLVTGGTTPVDIEAQNKKANVGISRIITLENGDKVTVRAKSDTATTGLTVAGINTTLWS